MELKQLFVVKEEIIRDLEKKMNKLSFENEEQKRMYYQASLDGIIEFYVRSSIVIMESETDSKKAS